MRYHFVEPVNSKDYTNKYGNTYKCDHMVYNRCTLFKNGEKGISVIQQRYNPIKKYTYWTEIDPWLTDLIYTNHNFEEFFNKHADKPTNNLYPTVTVRQIMWALKMKPIKKRKWETVFDRKYI